MFGTQLKNLKFTIAYSVIALAACSSTDNVFVDNSRDFFKARYSDHASLLVSTCEAALFNEALPETELENKNFARRGTLTDDSIRYERRSLENTKVYLPYSKKPNECFFRFDGVGGLLHITDTFMIFEPMNNGLSALGYIADNSSGLFTRGDRRLSLSGKHRRKTQGGVTTNDLTFTLTKM